MARDTWSGNEHISIEDYQMIFNIVENYKNENNLEEIVRIPQGFISQTSLNNEPEYYGYCSAKNADRALVFPNGMIRSCSLMIGTPYCIGYYNNNQLCYNESPTNELRFHSNNLTPCTNQCKKAYLKKESVPLCVSFKPKQDEYVWKNIIVRIAEENLIPIADELASHIACFAEPVGCVLNALEKLRIQPRERMIIYGGGTLGLIAALVALEKGAVPTIIEKNEEKIDKAGPFLRATGIECCKDTVASDFDIAFNASGSRYKRKRLILLHIKIMVFVDFFRCLQSTS